MKIFLIISILLACAYAKPTFLLAASLLQKLAQQGGIPNLVKVDAQVDTNMFGQKLNADAAFGIGEKGTGAHASVQGDILGQNANIHADVLDGNYNDLHTMNIYKDENGKAFIWDRQYVGTRMVYVKKYLTDAELQRYKDTATGQGYVVNIDKEKGKVTLDKTDANPNADITYLKQGIESEYNNRNVPFNRPSVNVNNNENYIRYNPFETAPKVNIFSEDTDYDDN